MCGPGKVLNRRALVCSGARFGRMRMKRAMLAAFAVFLGLAAGVLGRKEDETHYLGLAREVRQAFTREYVTPAGRLMSDAETAYALAIEFALLSSPEQRQHAGDRLDFAFGNVRGRERYSHLVPILFPVRF